MLVGLKFFCDFEIAKNTAVGETGGGEDFHGDDSHSRSFNSIAFQLASYHSSSQPTMSSDSPGLPWAHPSRRRQAPFDNGLPSVGGKSRVRVCPIRAPFSRVLGTLIKRRQSETAIPLP